MIYGKRLIAGNSYCLLEAAATFMGPPPAITSLALHPKPIKLLTGHHQKRVTGLAKLCIWETTGGEHTHTKSMQISDAEAKVQFYFYQV
ncbi:topless-related protein 4-like [Ananas comosus]|uniref:Topless-related protein 4-like n=1 Tax=Ananas comosus TaxID=4615 RepID=A0A6P5G345_ANACO|nr:topless-related protein 4-like [Ananas comosus]